MVVVVVVWNVDGVVVVVVVVVGPGVDGVSASSGN